MNQALYEKMAEDLHLKPMADMSLRDKFLNSLYRNHVIQAVKEPLMKAIMFAWKLLPDKPTRKNCRKRNSFLLIDFKEWFLENYDCKQRKELLEAALDLLIAEVEHDENYEDYFNLLAYFIHDRIEDGTWQEISKGRPHPIFWKLTREAINGDTDA